MEYYNKDFEAWAKANFGPNHLYWDEVAWCYDAWLEAEHSLRSKLAHILTEWSSKQGHDRCWYYPEIFEKLATTLGVDLSNFDIKLPPCDEFKEGCRRYQESQYGL